MLTRPRPRPTSPSGLRPPGLVERTARSKNKIQPKYHVPANHPWRKSWNRTFLLCVDTRRVRDGFEGSRRGSSQVNSWLKLAEWLQKELRTCVPRSWESLKNLRRGRDYSLTLFSDSVSSQTNRQCRPNC